MGNISPKDMKLVSDGVLDGSVQMNQLPDYAQKALSDYWGQSVDYTNPQVGEAQLQTLMNQRKQNEKGFFDSPIFKPIEWVGSKLYSFYSATVSPVLSTGLMAAHSIVYGRPDYIGEDGEWDAAKDYWNMAHTVSPGQAVWMLGLNNKEMQDRGIGYDQMANDKKLAIQGKYRDTPTVNDPFGTKTAAEEYFGQGASKYVTGTTDFAVSWYMDPLVLAGKGAGATKAALVTKPVSKQVELAGKIAEKEGLGPERAFDLFSQTPTFQSMVNQVEKVKAASPEQAALKLRRDMPTLSKSANGDALARLLVQARDADEVSDILRVSMGDMGGKLALDIKNVKIAGQIDTLTKRNVAHSSYYDGMSDAGKASPRGQKIKAAIDSESAYVTRLNQETRAIDDTLDAFGSIDSMNFNRVTTPLGMKMRGSKVVQDGSTLRPMTPRAAGGVIKAQGNLIYNATIGIPIKVARAYNDIKPTPFINVHGEDSYREVDAMLREVSGQKGLLSRGEREMLVSDYIKATPNERALQLTKIEQYTVSKMVERHNFKSGPDGKITLDLAKDLYGDFARRRRAGQVAASSSNRVYGTAEMADPANPGRTLRVAEIEADGGRMVSTPIFDTQLANSHVMMDFKVFERMLNEQGSAFQKLKNRGGDWINKAGTVADTLNQYWKFAQLFRLGYAPRAIADDFLGQVARFGGMAMLERTARGAGEIAVDVFTKTAKAGDMEMARIWARKEAQRIEELASQQAATKSHADRAQAFGTSGGQDALYWRDELIRVTDEITEAKLTHADMTRFTREGQGMKDVTIDRQVFEGPMAGKQGEMYKDFARGERNLQNIMGSQSDSYLRQMRRLNWENITPGTHGADKHLDAWFQHVNNQVGQSSIGKQVLAGKSEGELAHWMKSTPEGQKYRHDIGLKNISDYELATRVKAQVDYVLNPALPGMDAARRAILEGKLERKMLEDVPAAARPMVNGEQWRYAEGTSPVAEMLDKGINSWYRMMNTAPAAKLLRNPLFAQQYKANLADKVRILKAQGVTHIDEATRKTMEEGARMSALKDVKQYTFTMDHETKMAYMMRHFGAFFGAQQESWNRWARIIAEKPQALAHVAQTYGAPARAGITVDQNGNTVDAAGFATDPATGEKTLIPYTDRKMLIQVPDYLGGKGLNKALGLDEDASFVLPMSSFEVVMNTGDGALPVGTGPFVQVAALGIPGTEYSVADQPVIADWAEKLGVLPFGPPKDIFDALNPNTGKKFVDSKDDFSETKQRTMFHAMQVENYKWEQGLRETQPTWEELSDRASRWSMFRTASAFALPFSVNGQDPYQFFRDEFNRMQKLDVNSADEKFYEKYGDSFYSFSQSMSKNKSGLRPTQESVQMSQHYQDLIAKVGPEYAGLVVGAEGDGEFSSGAYHYQKSHTVDPSGGGADRVQMSARDAWDKANVSRGWKQFNSFRDQKYAELFDRGLTSFDDAGAEDLKDDVSILQDLLTKQVFPDGGENPYYNKAWETEFNSLDKGKYDRNAAAIWDIANDPEIMAKSVMPDGTVGIRSEMYGVRTYLTYRREMQKALFIRESAGGSADIAAQSNEDLKSSWDRMVISLIEKDTKFSTLHSRWFATDMGFSRKTEITPQEEGILKVKQPTLEGQPKPTMFDALEAGAR